MIGVNHETLRSLAQSRSAGLARAGDFRCLFCDVAAQFEVKNPSGMRAIPVSEQDRKLGLRFHWVRSDLPDPPGIPRCGGCGCRKITKTLNPIMPQGKASHIYLVNAGWCVCEKA